MVPVRRIYIFIFVFLFFVWLTVDLNKSNRNIHLLESSKTKFYYSPNDTHCPIANFKQETKEIVPMVDECTYFSIDWVNVVDNYAIFNDDMINKVGVIKCFYKSVTWKTDFTSSISPFWTGFVNNTYLSNNILLIRCKGGSLFHYYEKYLFGFEDKRSRSKKDHLKDIVIIGIDSVSRMAWKKYLGQSYQYMEKDMGESSTIFQKINVLGDGTTVNVLGILAGELEMDLYESRKGYPNAKHVDEYPWIWNTLHQQNYATYFDEDDVNFATFNYRLLGFKKKPTHFYGRIWRMVRGRRKHSVLCINNRNIFQDQLHNVRNFFKTVKNQKFVFMWSTYFSHDSNEQVQVLDDSLLHLLKEVNDQKGLFNDTVLVVMSDHGHRFNSRLHLQGKYEERLPFFFVHLPLSLRKSRPHLLKNMKKNQNKLITTFDGYASLNDIVNNFTSHSNNDSVVYRMSLFNPHIPFRSCEDVKIATHWCSCLKWIEMDVKEKVIKEAAEFIVTVINKETEEFRSKCHILHVDSIKRAHLIAPSEDVLKFHESDKDGRVPNMSDNTKVDGIYYRISFQTKPGDAIFEATVNTKLNNRKREFKIDVQSIDRSNQYAKWIWCLQSGIKDVRKFCLCK